MIISNSELDLQLNNPCKTSEAQFNKPYKVVLLLSTVSEANFDSNLPGNLRTGKSQYDPLPKLREYDPFARACRLGEHRRNLRHRIAFGIGARVPCGLDYESEKDNFN